MSKEEFLKIQTCVLKVNIHCDGCKRKVKKILQKIEGVYTVVIDSEQGKVTVSGNVDPPTLIKKLAKGGKHAEIWGAPKPNQPMNTLFKNMWIDGGKGSAGNNKNQGQKGQIQQEIGGKPQLKQGGSGGPTPQQLQQLKGFQDMKLPPFGGGGGKDVPKSVKFKMPESDESDDDDYYDDDDFDDDDDDDDDDYDDDDDDDELDDIPMKKPVMVGSGGGSQMANMLMNQQFMKGGQMTKGVPQIANTGGKKGGDGGNIPVQMNGGAKKADGGGNQNHGSGGKGVNINVNGLHGMPNMMAMSGGIGPMGHMGAVQGLPAGALMSSRGGTNGYLQGPGGGEIMAGNPYYQQQLAMNQQRANGNGRFQPMMYARPPPAVNYMQPPYSPYPYPQPPHGDPLTHYFSDDSTPSCNVM